MAGAQLTGGRSQWSGLIFNTENNVMLKASAVGPSLSVMPTRSKRPSRTWWARTTNVVCHRGDRQRLPGNQLGRNQLGNTATLATLTSAYVQSSAPIRRKTSLSVRCTDRKKANVKWKERLILIADVMLVMPPGPKPKHFARSHQDILPGAGTGDARNFPAPHPCLHRSPRDRDGRGLRSLWRLAAYPQIW